MERPIPRSWRSASPKTIAAATATLSDRIPARMGMATAMSARAATSTGTPAEFAADHQNVAVLEAAVEIGRRRLGGEQHEAARAGRRGEALGRPPRLEIVETGVSRDVHVIEIVHAGATQMPVTNGEPRRSDNGRVNAKTGAHPQHGSGVLRNVGLEQREHRRIWSRRRGHHVAVTLPAANGLAATHRSRRPRAAARRAQAPRARVSPRREIKSSC